MKTLTLRRRSGATLVELLVVMSVVAALGALALMVLPSIANSDATLKGTAEVQSALRISQGMAGSARLPRGVRFIANPGNSLLSTEMQYLEAPPVLVPDPQVLVGNRANNANGDAGPRVEFYYQTNTSGSVNNRWCVVRGLTSEQYAQLGAGSTVVLPALDAWSKVTGINTSNLPTAPTTPASISGTIDVELILEVYPDFRLGAAASSGAFPALTPVYRTYHFGLYGAPAPLIGEPTIQLPKNIAVDLSLCSPQGGGGNYDILFAPSGQLLVYASPTTANSSVFLWVRDMNKVPSIQPTSRSPWTFDPTKREFQLGGEQQIVGVRNGFVGTAPVAWPRADGTYDTTTPITDPYSFAKQRLN